ncbi:MAG: CHRD domain-containing protein [Nitrososphaeraceae archaeon]
MNNLRYSVAIVVTIWMFILISNVAFGQLSFRTNLTGDREVPPLFSESYGTALIVGNDSSLTYKINVTSLDKVTGVSLYKGDQTENGQVLVSLLNDSKPSGVIDGKLVEGTINSSSIMAPLANLTTNVTVSDVPLAVPAAGNLTNMTSAAGNLTNMTTAPPSKLESLIDLMNQNMTYINIHTSKFPEGELRGTLTNSTG